MTSSASSTPTDDLSLVLDDPPLRWQRRVGLVPRTGGVGAGRRALFWVAITWLPITAWAWWAGRALPEPGQTVEPLLEHFGVHARLLLGIPLLILAEVAAQRVMLRLMPQFVNAGIVQPADLLHFRAILASTARLRDAVLPWIVIGAIAFAWTITESVMHRAHDLSWAFEPGPASLGFGGWWYLYVGRPVFVALLVGWLWRLILLGTALWRIARLDLAIVPTHPDRAGGLGFVERFAGGFSLVAFVPAAVIAAGWAHDATYHDLDVHSLHAMMVAGLVIALAVFLAPYFAFAGPLGRAKKQALLDYGALVARHGAAVRDKWILGHARVDPPLLSAPEIGPVADTVALYEAVSRMRPVPLGRTALLAIALPVAIPFIAVLAIQIPLRELLQELAKGLL